MKQFVEATIFEEPLGDDGRKKGSMATTGGMVVFLMSRKVALIPFPGKTVEIQLEMLTVFAVDEPKITLFRRLDIRLGEKLADNRYRSVAVNPRKNRCRV